MIAHLFAAGLGSKRNFGTGRGRLPKELRLRNQGPRIKPRIPQERLHKRVQPALYGSPISTAKRLFQLDQTRWRNTLTTQLASVHEHLDGRNTLCQ